VVVLLLLLLLPSLHKGACSQVQPALLQCCHTASPPDVQQDEQQAGPQLNALQQKP
jgi:hypothetical protein